MTLTELGSRRLLVNDVWLDNFAAGNDSLRLGTPHDWSIRKRTLRGGLRDGIDLIEVHNGGLSFSVPVAINSRPSSRRRQGRVNRRA